MATDQKMSKYLRTRGPAWDRDLLAKASGGMKRIPKGTAVWTREGTGTVLKYLGRGWYMVQTPLRVIDVLTPPPINSCQ